MKKNRKTKKLALNCQTVRKLAAQDLTGIIGGDDTDNCTGYSCICTAVCSARTCPP